MSQHSFNARIASEVGINAAVLFKNIVYWCEKNAANGKHQHDGKTWTYNSMAAFEALFPYLTGAQIRRALEKLIEAGLIEAGNFNKSAYDRTKWYCVNEQIHLSFLANGFVQNDRPIPDIKPDTKPDEEKDASDEADFFTAMEEPIQEDQTDAQFERFWKEYPKKAGKPSARRAFDKAIKKVPPEELVSATQRYAAWLSNKKPFEFRPPAKHPQGWLNDERWNDPEIGEAKPARSKAAELAERYSKDEI